MKYFLDAEFIEDAVFIDLISIGIVAEDGREFYALNIDCDWNKASQWVRENVLTRLPDKPNDFEYSEVHKAEGWLRHSAIGDEVLKFVGGETYSINYPSKSNGAAVRGLKVGRRIKEGNPKPEFWAYYADSDWVVFYQLFGTMMDLPEGFPLYCRDLKQEEDRLGIDLSKAVPQENEHDALDDARWNWKAFKYLETLRTTLEIPLPILGSAPAPTVKLTTSHSGTGNTK